MRWLAAPGVLVALLSLAACGGSTKRATLSPQGFAAVSALAADFKDLEAHQPPLGLRKSAAIFGRTCARLGSFTDPEAQAVRAECLTWVRSARIGLVAARCAQLLYGSCGIAELRVLALLRMQLANANGLIVALLGPGPCRNGFAAAGAHYQRESVVDEALAAATATDRPTAVQTLSKKEQALRSSGVPHNLALKGWLARCNPHGAGRPSSANPLPRRKVTVRGGLELRYRVLSANAGPPSPAVVERTAQILRERLFGLGQYTPDINRGGSELVVVLPGARPGSPAAAELGRPGRVFFYDWEPNVIGPRGRPEAARTTATERIYAGTPATGLGEYQAVLRAARRPLIFRRNDTTLGHGRDGQYFLLDERRHKVLLGPEDSLADLDAEDYRPPAGSRPRVVHVKPGTVVVQAMAHELPVGGASMSSDRWYVLNDDPVLEGADITAAEQGYGQRPDGPVVNFCLSSRAEAVYHKLIERIHRRAGGKHFAVMIDDKLFLVPRVVEEISGGSGRHPEAPFCDSIGNGGTLASFQLLAGLLKTPALPARLRLISESTFPSH